MAAWTPPSTLEEKLKRAIIPPGLELRRIVARELHKGEPELRLLPFLIDPKRAAIDIGANRGIWAHEMARLCPKVFAFEPNPKMYRFLEAAAAHNVQCHNIALSDQAGEAKLLVPGAGARFSNQGASLNPTRMGDGAFATVTVEARTLDSYALPPIGFIKIDVEGHERAVIAGARKLIARDKPRLIVEIEARHTGTPVRTLTDEIEALGYRMMFNTPDGLRDGRYFDPDTMQCETNAKSAYINNFIFLPI